MCRDPRSIKLKFVHNYPIIQTYTEKKYQTLGAMIICNLTYHHFCPIYQAGHAFQGFKYVLLSIVIEIWMHDVKTDRNDRMVLGNVVVIPCLSIHHCPLYGKFTGVRWIPHTKGQSHGKCFHLMTSSWIYNQSGSNSNAVNPYVLGAWAVIARKYVLQMRHITESWVRLNIEQITGPRLNIKTVLSTYGDFHVRDKTAVRTSYL